MPANTESLPASGGGLAAAAGPPAPRRRGQGEIGAARTRYRSQRDRQPQPSLNPRASPCTAMLRRVSLVTRPPPLLARASSHGSGGMVGCALPARRAASQAWAGEITRGKQIRPDRVLLCTEHPPERPAAPAAGEDAPAMRPPIRHTFVNLSVAGLSAAVLAASWAGIVGGDAAGAGDQPAVVTARPKDDELRFRWPIELDDDEDDKRERLARVRPSTPPPAAATATPDAPVRPAALPPVATATATPVPPIAATPAVTPTATPPVVPAALPTPVPTLIPAPRPNATATPTVTPRRRSRVS